MIRRSESNAPRMDAIREFIEAAEESHTAYERLQDARENCMLLHIGMDEIYAAWHDR